MQKREVGKRIGKGQQQLLVWQPDYVVAEQNLETIGFFSARYTRPSLREEKELSKVIVLSDGRRIEIVPAAKYGFPNAEDLDYYRAFLKICDEHAEFVAVQDGDKLTYHPRLPSPIGFSSRELIAKAGKIKNGRSHLSVRNWIERLSSTTIHGALFNAKVRHYDVHMGLEPLFRQYVLVGRPMNNGELAAQNYVWLAEWFVNNYYHLYARRVDLKFHHSLSHAISKTLYPILDTGWYASSGGPYTKRYADLCSLLGIKAYRQLSKTRYQLDPSNEELLHKQFLGRYDYPLDEDGAWTGTVRWWPGPKWLYDQETRHRQKRRTETDRLPALAGEQYHDPSHESSQMALPLLRSQGSDMSSQGYIPLVRQFYERLGQVRLSREKTQMGVSVLRNLVEEQHYTKEEVEFALDWIIRNLQGRFSGRIQSLGIVPHIISEALQEKAVREQKQDRDRLRQREKQTERERDVQVQLLAKKLDALPFEERTRLRTEAIKSLTNQGFQRQFLMESMIKIEMVRLIEQEGNSL